ncbi:hypothetical protein BT69DRAFT_1047600 [Atractiella rhizophila]|nr:hypothetical protein BT69DRAFT_1047600 [Atractiella rhizophila]
MAIFGTKKPKHSSQHSSSISTQPGASPPMAASRNAGNPSSSSQPVALRNPPDNFRQGPDSVISNSGQIPNSKPGGPAMAGDPRAGNRPPPNQPRQAPSGAPAQNVLYPWSIVKLQAPSSSVSLDGPIPSPFPRYGHSINPVSSSGDLYIFGGLVRDLVKNDLYCISTSHTVANPTASLPVQLLETYGERPGARVGHSSVGVGNVLIVWGGDTKIRKEDKQDEGLYLLNLGTREWTRVKIQGSSPIGRYGHSAAMVGSRFFVFGGQKDDGGFLNDLSWFDLQKLKAGTPRWNFIEYADGMVLPARRTGHTTVTHGDCIYVFGGTDGSYHYNDTWCFDTNTQTWQELSCIGYIPVPREGHAATLVDDVMYVFGGRGVDGKDLEDLAAFKISNRRWYMFQNMGPNPSGRSGHAMATWQSKVFVLGGESYTSKKMDDPSFVHVLDTAKIKYPADSKAKDGQPQSQQIGKKTSATQITQVPSQSSGNHAPPSVQVVPPSMTPTPPSTGDVAANQIPLNNLTDEDRRRAASPPNVEGRRPAAQQSLAQNQPGKKSNGIVQNAAPIRPRREGDDDPSMQLRKTFVAGGPSRAASPTQMVNTRSMSPSNGKSRTPMQDQGVYRSMGPTPSENDHRQPQSFEATKAPAVLPSSAPTKSIDNPEERAPKQMVADQAWMLAALALASTKGFLPPASTDPADTEASAPTKSIDNPEERAPKQMVADQAWMLAALALASTKGFLPPASTDPADTEAVKDIAIGAEGSDHRLLFDLMMQLKQELGRAKVVMAEQAVLWDGKLTEAHQLRLAATKEAAYYRSKLAAIEGNALVDMNKLDKERLIDLERKLSESLGIRNDALQRITQLESQLKHEQDMRKTAEDNAASAIERAQAAETSYTRSLTDYAELQRRARTNEGTVQDHFEKMAILSSASTQAAAENTRLKDQVQEAQASLDQYLRTLEQTRSTLTAANAQADEMETLWEQTKSELSAETLRTKQLQMEVDAQKAEVERANARVIEVETVLKNLREECSAMRKLTSESLAELVSNSRNLKPKEDDDSLETDRIRAIQAEADTLRSMQKQTRQQYETSLQENEEAKGKQVQAEKQVFVLRSEVASLRAHVSTSMDESSRLKRQLSELETELREKNRQFEAAELKIGVWRSVLTENGLVVNEDDMNRPTRSPTADAPDHVLRIEELERRARELELAHDNAQRETFRKNAEIDQLSEELDRLRSRPASRSVDGHEGEDLSTLQTLQERHRQLEGSHSKALLYIKSTEKLQRKLKDELAKSKEKAEELETQLAAKSDDTTSQDMKKELESVRAQLRELSHFSTQASSENKALEKKMSSLKAEYEDQIEALHRSNDASATQLREELSRARQSEARLKREKESLDLQVQDLQQKVSILLESIEENMVGEEKSSMDHQRASSEYSLDTGRSFQTSK